MLITSEISSFGRKTLASLAAPGLRSGKRRNCQHYVRMGTRPNQGVIRTEAVMIESYFHKYVASDLIRPRGVNRPEGVRRKRVTALWIA